MLAGGRADLLELHTGLLTDLIWPLGTRGLLLGLGQISGEGAAVDSSQRSMKETQAQLAAATAVSRDRAHSCDAPVIGHEVKHLRKDFCQFPHWVVWLFAADLLFICSLLINAWQISPPKVGLLINVLR